MKINFNKINWEENLSLIIILLSFVDLFSERLHEILKWPIIFLGILSLILCILLHKRRKIIITVIIIMIVLMIMELFISDGIKPTQYIWDLGICLPVGLCIYFAKKVNLKKWIQLYIAISIVLIVRLFSVPDHYSILYSHSRNYISVFIISILFICSVIAYKLQVNVPKWMYYSTTLICIISIGRGGVVSGLFIMVGYLLYDVYSEKHFNKKTNKLLALIIIGISITTIIVIFPNIIIQKIFPRFATSGIAASNSKGAVATRLLMWRIYFQLCFETFLNFLFGVNPFYVTSTAGYRLDFNLHNSFLMLHVYYGFFGFLMFGFIMLAFLKKFWNKKGGFVAIIFLGYMIRALFDHCFPGKLSGIVVWIALFYGLDFTKKERKLTRLVNNDEQNH